MPLPYTPTAVELTGPINLPQDGELRSAASVNDPIAEVADGVKYLNAAVDSMIRITTQTVLASGTVVAPAGAVGAILDGCGGGGGGGGGAGRPSVDIRNSGGAGGGGAVRKMVRVDIVGGASYSVVVGPGGGGAAGASTGAGGAGSDGGDTTFTKVTGAVLLATFRGAGKGAGGNVETFGAGGGGLVAVFGGTPVRRSITPGLIISITGQASTAPHTRLLNIETLVPQAGGAGFSNNFIPAVEGGSSPEGFAGGMSGSFGTPTTSGSYQAGGCGGGGGAGPYGAGGGGGTGGAPNNGGAAGDGTLGASAAANTGAGGGGGGGGGSGTTGGAGGTGGTGGSGKLIITWLIAGP